MAVSVSIARGAPTSGFAVGRAVQNFTVTVTNGNASAVTLNSLAIANYSGDACLSQPVFQAPGAYGTGLPSIAAGASASYSFQATFSGPVTPGPSVQAPGGTVPSGDRAIENSVWGLIATCATSDGAVAEFRQEVPTLTATFPQSNGGAMVLSQGFNLVNALVLGTP